MAGRTGNHAKDTLILNSPDNRSMSVGVQKWDSDHRKLLELIDQFCNLDLSTGSSAAVKKIMISLLNYSEIHLRSEERAMEQLRYPGFVAHKEEHDKYRRWFKEQNDLRINTPDEWDVRQVSDFLTHWWRSHILEVDMAYKNYFETMNDDVTAHLEKYNGVTSI
jgi:hemerythrin-like metal-binding protein